MKEIALRIKRRPKYIAIEPMAEDDTCEGVASSQVVREPDTLVLNSLPASTCEICRLAIIPVRQGTLAYYYRVHSSSFCPRDDYVGYRFHRKSRELFARPRD